MKRVTILVAAALALVAPAVPAGASEALPNLGCPATSGGIAVASWSHDVGTDDVSDWSTVAPVAGPAYGVSPNTAWVTSPDASWINWRDTRTSTFTGGPLPDRMTYRTEFELPELAFQRSLDLTFAADNGVTFFLNGVPIGGYDPPVPAGTIPKADAFRQWHTLSIVETGFLDGVNQLDAVVSDYGGDTGVIVLGTARACQPGISPRGVCVEVARDHLGLIAYSPAPYDLGTVSNTDWAVTAPVAGPANPITTYAGWVAGTWVGNGTTPQTSGSATYEVTFPMAAGATQQDVDITFAADNDVLFYLNGTPIGGFAPDAFKVKRHLLWSGAGFVTGTNVLRAVVTDRGVASGLLVEGGAHACPGRLAG